MTVMRLNYRGRGGQPAAGAPPQRDLDRADIVALSGAGFGIDEDTWTQLAADREVGITDPVVMELDAITQARGRRKAHGIPVTVDAPVGSAAWLAKIDTFVAACVATGRYTTVETDDPADSVGGI